MPRAKHAKKWPARLKWITLGLRLSYNGSRGGGGVNQNPTVRHMSLWHPSYRLPLAGSLSLLPLLCASCWLRQSTREKRKERYSGKVFTLRNINPVCVSKVEDLKSLIKAQLSDDLPDRFDVGYILNNKVVSLRSKEDIRDLMGSVQKGDNVLLWCDGLRK